MKRKSHPLITKGILILLSLIVLIFITSYAWFTSINNPVTATNVSITSSKTSNFEVAVGFYSSETGDYLTTDFTTSTINLAHLTVSEDDEEEYSIYDSWSPKDLTGSGGWDGTRYTLIRPGLQNRNKEVKENPFSYTVPTPGKEFLMFDFIFRSDSAAAISLAEKSFAKASCEAAVADGSLSEDDTTGQGFSVDAIVGSLRVSFDPFNFQSGDTLSKVLSEDVSRLVCDEGNTPGASCVWIPRPDLFLNQPDRDVESYSLITGLSDNSKGTFNHKYWAPSTGDTGVEKTFPTNKTLVGSDNEYGAKTVSLASDSNVKKCKICDFSLNEDEYYYGKVRVFIWTEGDDAEARKILVGGQYSISMDLLQG